MDAFRLAEFQNFLTAFPLLLKQGKLKDEVGLNVDFHAAASYSMRPFLTAVRNPDIVSQLSSSTLAFEFSDD